jgi:hypothetical protein
MHTIMLLSWYFFIHVDPGGIFFWLRPCLNSSIGFAIPQLFSVLRYCLRLLHASDTLASLLWYFFKYLQTVHQQVPWCSGKAYALWPWAHGFKYWYESGSHYVCGYGPGLGLMAGRPRDMARLAASPRIDRDMRRPCLPRFYKLSRSPQPNVTHMPLINPNILSSTIFIAYK